MNRKHPKWQINGRCFKSRLLHCFGDLGDSIDVETAVGIVTASETEFVTVYTHGDLRKVARKEDFPIGYSGVTFGDVADHIPIERYTVLVNTNHAQTVEEAIDRAQYGSQLSGSDWIKLEVLNTDLTRPINQAVITAAKALVDKGFVVLPLINTNAGDIKTLESIGCSAIRLIMSDIGSGRGLSDFDEFALACSQTTLPIIAEGGLGGPEDAYNAMIAGASAVLVNKALFSFRDPFSLIGALKSSLASGRCSYNCNLQRKHHRAEQGRGREN